MKCIHIFKDGKMDELIIGKNIIKSLTKASLSQGINELTKMYSWKFEGNDICCFGWYDGDNGFVNSHDLPHGGKSDFLEEDSSEKIIFGDMFILRYKDDKVCPITISDYSVFYSDRFENFSNYGSDTEEDIEYNDEVVIQQIDDNDEEFIEEAVNFDLDYDNYEY